MIKQAKDGRYFDGDLVDVMPLHYLNAMRKQSNISAEAGAYYRSEMIKSITDLQETIDHFKRDLGLDKTK